MIQFFFLGGKGLWKAAAEEGWQGHGEARGLGGEGDLSSQQWLSDCG